jgi:hypothetical protein
MDTHMDARQPFFLSSLLLTTPAPFSPPCLEFDEENAEVDELEPRIARFLSQSL